MKFRDVKAGRQYQWNGRVFLSDGELDRCTPCIITVEAAERDGDLAKRFMRASGGPFTWLRAPDLSPLPESEVPQ